MKNLIKATNRQNNETVYWVVPTQNVNNVIELIADFDVDYSVFEIGKMPLTELPEDVQEKVRESLTVFDKTNVTFEFNRFDVSPHTCIRANYNYDHFVCGTYRADEVYTEEERKQHLRELNSYEFPEWAW